MLLWIALAMLGSPGSEAASSRMVQADVLLQLYDAETMMLVVDDTIDGRHGDGVADSVFLIGIDGPLPALAFRGAATVLIADDGLRVVPKSRL